MHLQKHDNRAEMQIFTMTWWWVAKNIRKRVKGKGTKRKVGNFGIIRRAELAEKTVYRKMFAYYVFTHCTVHWKANLHGDL